MHYLWFHDNSTLQQKCKCQYMAILPPPPVLPTLYDSAESLKCDLVVHGTIFCFHEPTKILFWSNYEK